ncbi:MAG TPA: SLBB domain-containing protein [Verrucomicrobiae bacterium]|nr:SLBB domain-containing protein [Verrucomicrobiae bacterium]
MKTVRGKKGQGICLASIVLVLAFASGCLMPGPKFNPYIPSTYNESTFAQIKLTNAVPKPELLKPSGTFFTLGPGDKLDLEILGDTTTRTQTTVGPDGKIYFHLLPGLDVWGLTLAETKALLEKELQRFIKDQPVVSVTLRNVESKKIWLLGRFTTPGVYTMNAPMTVLEAFAMAGGTMSMAGQRDSGAALTGEEVGDLRKAFVMRNGERLPIDLYALLNKGDLSQNIYLEPDDFIYVPTATMREVTVLGAVAQPRSVPYVEGMGLIQAISHANGTAPEAYQHHVAIVRGSLSEPRVGIIDYKDIAMGRVPDVPLEPGDIVYVPYGPYRYLVRYADLILRTFLNTVAINEGTRAASARQTSVVIPIGGGATAPTPQPVIRP